MGGVKLFYSFKGNQFFACVSRGCNYCLSCGPNFHIPHLSIKWSLPKRFSTTRSSTISHATLMCVSSFVSVKSENLFGVYHTMLCSTGSTTNCPGTCHLDALMLLNAVHYNLVWQHHATVALYG